MPLNNQTNSIYAEMCVLRLPVVPKYYLILSDDFWQIVSLYYLLNSIRLTLPILAESLPLSLSLSLSVCLYIYIYI